MKAIPVMVEYADEQHNIRRRNGGKATVKCWTVGTAAALELYAKTKDDRSEAGLTEYDIQYPLLHADKEVYERTDYACVRMGQRVALFAPGTDTDGALVLISTLDESLYRHEHDCLSCVFLGQHGEFDMWICPPDRNDVQFLSGSMIARYGEDGEYASSGLCMIGRMLEWARQRSNVDYADAMLTAAARALRLGLVTPWHLRDGLTELSVTQIRQGLEAVGCGEMPKFLLEF